MTFPSVDVIIFYFLNTESLLSRGPDTAGSWFWQALRALKIFPPTKPPSPPVPSPEPSERPFWGIPPGVHENVIILRYRGKWSGKNGSKSGFVVCLHHVLFWLKIERREVCLCVFQCIARVCRVYWMWNLLKMTKLERASCVCVSSSL